MQPSQSYNAVTNDNYTNTIIKKINDTIILITKIFRDRRNKAGEVGTIVDLGAIDHCFADIDIFKEYEKFETLSTEKTS